MTYQRTLGDSAVSSATTANLAAATTSSDASGGFDLLGALKSLVSPITNAFASADQGVTTVVTAETTTSPFDQIKNALTSPIGLAAGAVAIALAVKHYRSKKGR